MSDPGNSIITNLCDCLHAQLVLVGFVRNGRRLWSRKTDGITTLVGLEKSPWGQQYYLEFGFIVEGAPSVIGDHVAANPKIHHAHVRQRGETLLPMWREVSARTLPLSQWLDLENDLKLSSRIEEFRHFIAEQLVSVLQECTTISDLRRLYKQGALSAAIVHQSVVGLLAGR